MRRRTLLATLSAGVLGSAGCLSWVGLAHTGYLQFKQVAVEWPHEGRTYRDQPLWTAYGGGEELPRGRVDGHHTDLVGGVREVVATDAAHERLERVFPTVRYYLGFCAESMADGDETQGCHNTWCSRADFNAVQFGDRAEVTFRGDEVQVVDTYPGEQAEVDGWREFHTFDFYDLHREHGIPDPPRD